MKVVVVDDHPVFRSGLRTLLGDLDVEVVAEASDGAEGVAAVLEHRPDLVLMDLHMPGMGGIEAIRRLSAEWPHVKVLVLTMVDDDQGIHAALKAGALGYLLKGAGLEEMGQALAAASGGHGVFSPAVANRLRRFFASGAAQPFPMLSDRERDVLTLIASGAPNAVIARQLFLSEKTVRNYVSSIFTKLDVPDRAAAIVMARRAGIGG